MEDAHISKTDLIADANYFYDSKIDNETNSKRLSLFAVFDGHGGKEVSMFCKDHFIQELTKTNEFRNGNYIAALRQTFHRMDELLDDEVL
jgi:serine/threonine protein phosphatase PrpC